MKPIPFPEANKIVGNEIPVNENHGLILSRWGMTWRERLSILIHGRIWMAVKGNLMPPILLSGDQEFDIDEH